MADRQALMTKTIRGLKRTAEVSTQTKHHVKLTGEGLRQLFADAGFKVPKHACIAVRVPGGGDWSNTNLEIDQDHVLEIWWIDVKDSKPTKV